MFELILYQSKNETYPVLEFINSLTQKDKAKIYVILKLLKEQGFLPFPYSSDIKEYPKIRELRIQSLGQKIRIYYSMLKDKKIILLHGFIKRDNKEVKRNNEIAYDRFIDYLKRKDSKHEQEK